MVFVKCQHSQGNEDSEIMPKSEPHIPDLFALTPDCCPSTLVLHLLSLLSLTHILDCRVEHQGTQQGQGSCQQSQSDPAPHKLTCM